MKSFKTLLLAFCMALPAVGALAQTTRFAPDKRTPEPFPGAKIPGLSVSIQSESEQLDSMVITQRLTPDADFFRTRKTWDTYDNAGRKTTSTGFGRSFPDASWNEESRDSLFYNAQNENHLIKRFTRQGANWVGTQLESRTYYPFGLPQTLVRQNRILSGWINLEKQEFIYSPDSMPQSFTYYTWNIPSNQWVIAGKFIWEYGPSNLAQRLLYIYWENNLSPGDTVDIYKYAYVGNTIEIEYRFNKTGSVWDTVECRKTYFPVGGPADSSQLYFKQNGSWNMVVRSLFRYNNQNQPTWAQYWNRVPGSEDWYLPWQEDYYYSASGSTRAGSLISAEPDLMVYPNPVRDRLYMADREGSLGHYRIRDLSGKTLLESHTGQNPEINVAFLKPGLYQLQSIQPGKKPRSARFVKTN